MQKLYIKIFYEKIVTITITKFNCLQKGSLKICLDFMYVLLRLLTLSQLGGIRILSTPYVFFSITQKPHSLKCSKLAKSWPGIPKKSPFSTLWAKSQGEGMEKTPPLSILDTNIMIGLNSKCMTFIFFRLKIFSIFLQFNIERIHKMSSWQFFNWFIQLYSILLLNKETKYPLNSKLNFFSQIENLFNFSTI